MPHPIPLTSSARFIPMDKSQGLSRAGMGNIAFWGYIAILRSICHLPLQKHMDMIPFLQSLDEKSKLFANCPFAKLYAYFSISIYLRRKRLSSLPPLSLG